MASSKSFVLSRFLGVAIDGVWIRYWIYLPAQWLLLLQSIVLWTVVLSHNTASYPHTYTCPHPPSKQSPLATCFNTPDNANLLVGMLSPIYGGWFIIIFICLRRENVFFRVITCSQCMHSIKLYCSISFHSNYWKYITEKRWKFPEIEASHFAMLLLWVKKRRQ